MMVAMTRKFRYITLVLALASLLALPILISQRAQAVDSDSEACKALVEAGGTGCSDDPNASDSRSTLQKLVASVVSILAWVIGVAAVIMIIVGAFKYITSGGDSNRVSNAKNTIMYALIGLAIAALAGLLVRYVLNQTDPTPTTQNTPDNSRPLDGPL